MNAADLTSGERYLIDRRRRNESQHEAARRLRVTLYRYRAMEFGEDGKGPAVGRLAEHELCFLLRRRADVLVQDLASELGLSAWWVTQMERGQVAADRLVDYWFGSAA